MRPPRSALISKETSWMRSPHDADRLFLPFSLRSVRYGLASGSCLGGLDEVSSPRRLEMVESVDLPGHLHRVAIDRVVPALDIDGPFEAGETKFADDARPSPAAEP